MGTTLASACACFAVSCSALASPFLVLSHSAQYDTGTQQVFFTIVASSPPDFFTVDEHGRQKNAFQFYLNIDPTMSAPSGPWERIVRGGEIYINGDLRMRNPYLPAAPGEPSGGWGPIVEVVPYSLVGTKVTFAYSYESLGTTTGAFAYQVLGVVYGASTGPLQNGESVPIPGPGAPVLLLGLTVVLRRRRTDRTGAMS